MFEGCKSFNQPLDFNTSNVINMGSMFDGCRNFNQSLDFDTSNVINMESMFEGCKSFNQPLDFDTSNVTNMESMFDGADKYKQFRGREILLKIYDSFSHVPEEQPLNHIEKFLADENAIKGLAEYLGPEENPTNLVTRGGKVGFTFKRGKKRKARKTRKTKKNKKNKKTRKTRKTRRKT